MAPMAESLWAKLGNAKIDPYDGNRDGAYYVCKLVSHQNGLILSGNLDQMDYHGPSDLLAAAAEDPYVPAHLKDRVFGDYLVVRRRQGQLSSAPKAPGRPWQPEFVKTPALSTCDSRQGAGHGVLWEFRNTELHKPVWIPPIH